jgi:hypothetical protein
VGLVLTLLAVVAATQAAAEPPVVDSEAVSAISSTGAVLEAKINPESMEQGATYQFQVVANPSEYASSFMCPAEGFPANSSLCLKLGKEAGALPLGSTSAGLQDQSASTDLANFGGWGPGNVTLEPGTTYHYRVIVARSVQTEDTFAWAPPIVYGPDQTFTTSAGPSPPSIESVSVANLTSSDATLGAQIDTEGLEAEYEFKMWASPCGPRCELIQDVHLPKGKLLGSFVAQIVSLDLASAGFKLDPGGEYGYSLIAVSAAGTSEYRWQTFTAPSGSAPTIEAESATDVTATDATLGATIDTQNLYTAYEFQIDTNSTYDYTRPACALELPGFGVCQVIIVGEPLPFGLVEPPPGSIPSGSGTQAVSVGLASIGVTLQPGTTYHYRVIAANTSNGQVVTGPDKTFTTSQDGMVQPQAGRPGPSLPPEQLDPQRVDKPRHHKHGKPKHPKHPKHHGKRHSKSKAVRPARR